MISFCSVDNTYDDDDDDDDISLHISRATGLEGDPLPSEVDNDNEVLLMLRSNDGETDGGGGDVDGSWRILEENVSVLDNDLEIIMAWLLFDCDVVVSGDKYNDEGRQLLLCISLSLRALFSVILTF